MFLSRRKPSSVNIVNLDVINLKTNGFFSEDSSMGVFADTVSSELAKQLNEKTVANIHILNSTISYPYVMHLIK